MLGKLAESRKMVVGVKQVVRAIDASKAEIVYIATDVDVRIGEPLIERCVEANVKFERAGSMIELGRACGIHVGAAAAAVLKV